MAEINLLFLAPHWRVTLVRAFQESWTKRQLPGRFIGVDSDPDAGAMRLLPCSYTVPRFTERDCLKQLTDICKKESVTAILPLTNKAVDFLDQNRSKLKSRLAYLPGPQTVAVCHDKMKLAERFSEGACRVPQTFLSTSVPEDVEFPLIAKQRTGEGSRDVCRIEDAEDLAFYKSKFPDHVFQRLVTGVEFSIDWFCDRDGTPRVVVPRERLVVRGGEVMKSKIRMLPSIREAVIQVGESLSLVGPATIQGIVDSSDQFWLTDINLRFGSGYVHTMAAGVDVPMLIHQELSDQPIENLDGSVQDGSLMARYPDHLLF